MKNHSIRKRKSIVNGQTLVELKEVPKRDPKVSFKEAVNNLQLKLLQKQIKPKSNSSSKSLPSFTSDDDQPPSKMNLNRRASYQYNGLNNELNKKNFKSSSNTDLNKVNLDKNEKVLRKSSKRYTMRLKHGKNFEEKYMYKKSKGELSTIKEIIMPDNNENVVNSFPKKKVDFFEEINEEKPNKKVNIIEELKNFDINEQMKMEHYIDKKRKKQNEFNYKNNKMYKIISNENENEMNIDIKNNNQNNGNNKENYNNNINKQNDNNNTSNNIDDFQKIKQKYFSKNIFTTKFPETEYKIKYLDNYFQKESLSKNLFANYADEKEESNKDEKNNTTNNKNNLSKNIFKTPLNHTQKEKNNNKNDSNEKSSTITMTPKMLYKKINENGIDATNTINIEPSYHSYTFTIPSNKYQKEDNEINSAYKMIIKSIDDKINNKHNNKNIFSPDNYKRGISSSTGKINLNTQNNIYKSSFRDRALMYKNKSYYRDINDKYDKYNRLKMTPHIIRNTSGNNHNNYYNNYNKEYNIIKMFNEIKYGIRAYKQKSFPF